MAKRILVCGATGNQGGSVAKFLLKHPEQYSVRALTRNRDSKPAVELEKQGAEIFVGDMTLYEDLAAATKGCWGVFGVTNFYDPKVVGKPSSEEEQGRNLVKAAQEAGVVCFIWSTLPSSEKISGGRFISQIYEGKHKVDSYIHDINLPACFLLTGNFYENMTLRNHVHYDSTEDKFEFRQPIILPGTKLAMLYVEKDLSGIAKAIFDQWDTKQSQLHHQYLYASNARVTPAEITASIQKISGKPCTYTVLPTTGVHDRDIMFELYNAQGMYGTKEIPDRNVVDGLGVKMHGIDDFVKDTLLPHLGF